MRLLPERTPLRIGAFVAVLVVLFGVAVGAGRLFDEGTPETSGAPVSASYELRLESGTVSEGPRAPVQFTIVDQDDQSVAGFEVRHQKRLHLIAVRDDFSGFQHVHPTMAADGTWSTPLAVLSGRYRLFADFQASGSSEAVAYADLSVSGTSDGGFTSFPPRVARTTTVDGYQVTLAGDLAPDTEALLTLTVRRNGSEVTDLQPYLGAFGHLVVLRGSDKQYLHAHPEDGPAGPEIAFDVRVPTQGRYYLYLDFKHGGQVRTAQFALDTTVSGEGGEDQLGEGQLGEDQLGDDQGASHDSH